MNISIRDLWFRYSNDVEALRGITLDIAAGESVVLVGQNGSGKTTLAKHLNGLLRPTRGDVEIGGWNTRGHTVAQMARRVGFLFQNPDDQIFKNRVADEVAFSLRIFGFKEESIAARVEAALAHTDLAGEANTHPYELLPSQRKWVALASLLAVDPPVLVLDEPTTGQDARGLARLGALIDELKQAGKTVVAISHDVDFCAEHFDRVAVMKEGRILADGATAEVLAQAALLAETAVDPPQITRLGAALGLPRAVMTVEEFMGEWRSSS